MPAILVFDVGKMIDAYKNIQNGKKYSSDDKINCFKKLLDIQENIKLTNNDTYKKEYKKEYELCENIIKY